jgi:hypothetical protein
MTKPKPTQQDIDNAETRAAIAQKQNEEWGRVYAWALGAFGPGWEPVGRHYLVDKVEEEAARKEDRTAVAAMTAYCVKNGAGRRRYFTVDDGKVTEHLGYQEAFGPKLTELHPTLRFMHRGKELPAHHYSLCWGCLISASSAYFSYVWLAVQWFACGSSFDHLAARSFRNFSTVLRTTAVGIA